jgi:hypothetical protein
VSALVSFGIDDILLQRLRVPGVKLRTNTYFRFLPLYANGELLSIQLAT